MQKLFIILIFILILVLCLSIFIINMVRKDVVHGPLIKEKSEAGIGSKGHPGPGLGLQDIKIPEAKSSPIETSKEAEYDLDKIPVQEARDLVEKRNKEEVPEENETSEGALNTQPPVERLEELKIKGAVIY